MRLICPNCNAQYNVDEALIPEEGRDVQCATCKKSWFQEKSFDETPLDLTPSVQPEAARKTPTSPAAPETPRQTLDDSETNTAEPTSPPAQPVNDSVDRDKLRRVVEEEIAAKSGFDDDDIAEPADETDEDSELLRSLRETLAEVTEDDYEIGPATSRRRSVVQAAESAGIPTDELLADRTSKPKPTDISIDFVEELNETRPRRRLMSRGKMTALILAAILAGVYFFQGKIAEAYPPAAPFLEQYTAAVDGARSGVESLVTMVGELIANRSEPTEEIVTTEPASE